VGESVWRVGGVWACRIASQLYRGVFLPNVTVTRRFDERPIAFATWGADVYQFCAAIATPRYMPPRGLDL